MGDPDDDSTVIRGTGGALPGADDDATIALPAGAAGAAPARARRSTESANALAVGTRLGEFEITGVVGEGGFGIVYLALDHSLGRQVALKEYMPAALAVRTGGREVEVQSERYQDTFEAGRRSFVNEARLLAQFDHPALVKVYRFWEANGTAYMVMPYYQGLTLKQQLKTMAQPPDEAWLMRLLGPLSEALTVLHREHCYHRDIAPDNVILLGNQLRPVLLDFGAARQVINDMTRALTVILKPGYAPVEQYAEVPSMRQGPWTDVYALAATVYFAIRGTPPPDSVGRLMDDSYVPLATACAGAYSPRFLDAIDRALALRPEQRTPSIEALRADLGLESSAGADERATVIGGNRAGGAPGTAGTSAGMARPGGPQATVIAAPGEPALPRRTSPAVLAAVAAAVVLAGAGGAWWLFGRSPAKPPAAAEIASGPAAASGPAGPTGALPGAPNAGVAAAPAAPAPAPVPTQPAGSATGGGAGGVNATVASASALAPAVSGATSGGPAADSAMPAGPFDAGAEIERVLAAQDPALHLEAAPLASRLRIDKDDLKFSLRSSVSGEVTLLAYGTDGVLTRLIPSRSTPHLRIAADQTLRLPPANAGITAAEPAGTERLLVIVAPRGRGYSNFRSHVDAGGYLVLESPLGSVRGSDGRALPLLLGDAGDCKGEHCNAYGAAAFSVDVVK